MRRGGGGDIALVVTQHSFGTDTLGSLRWSAQDNSRNVRGDPLISEMARDGSTDNRAYRRLCDSEASIYARNTALDNVSQF